MGVLNFCPYDGKQIHHENLAYEITFPAGWSWDRVKKETIIGPARKAYISEEQSARGRILVLANLNRDGKSGMQYLQDFIRRGGQEAAEGEGGAFTQMMLQIYDKPLSIPYLNHAREEDAFQNHGPMKLHIREDDGAFTFLGTDEEPIFYAKPCCPYCHKILPTGWITADDFLGFAMTGEVEYGNETVFQTANASPLCLEEKKHGNAVVLQNLSLYEKEIFKIRRKGFEPESLSVEKLTEEGSQVPAFMHVRYKSHSDRKHLILGFYEHYSPNSNPDSPESRLYARMGENMVFYDPSEICPRSASNKDTQTRFAPSRLLSPEEQARFQKKNAGQSISAAELLAAYWEEREETNSDITQPVLEHIYNWIMENGRRKM